MASVRDWDTFRLCNWLGNNGFEKYMNIFSKYDINGEMIQMDVTDNDLVNEFGMSHIKVKSLRRKIQEADGALSKQSSKKAVIDMDGLAADSDGDDGHDFDDKPPKLKKTKDPSPAPTLAPASLLSEFNRACRNAMISPVRKKGEKKKPRNMPPPPPMSTTSETTKQNSHEGRTTTGPPRNIVLTIEEPPIPDTNSMDESIEGESGKINGERWFCTCVFFNTANDEFCEQCGQERPANPPARPPVAPADPVNSTIVQILKVICPQCRYENKINTPPPNIPSVTMACGQCKNIITARNPIHPKMQPAQNPPPIQIPPPYGHQQHPSNFRPSSTASPQAMQIRSGSLNMPNHSPIRPMGPPGSIMQYRSGSISTPGTSNAIFTHPPQRWALNANQFNHHSSASVASYRVHPYSNYAPSVASSYAGAPSYSRAGSVRSESVVRSASNAPSHLFQRNDTSDAGSQNSEQFTTRSLRGYSFHHVSIPEHKSRILAAPPKRKVSAPVDLGIDGQAKYRYPYNQSSPTILKPKDKKPKSRKKRKYLDLWRKWRVIRPEGVFIKDEETKKLVHLASGTVVTDRAADHSRIRVSKPLGWLNYRDGQDWNIVCLGDPFVHMSLCVLDSVPELSKEITDIIGSFLGHVVTTSRNKSIVSGHNFSFDRKSRIGFVIRTPPHHHESWVLWKFQLHLLQMPEANVKFRMSLVPYDRDIPNPEPIYISTWRGAKKSIVRFKPALMIPSYPNQFLIDIQTSSKTPVKVKVVKPNHHDFIRLCLFVHNGNKWQTKQKMMLPCTFELISVPLAE